MKTNLFEFKVNEESRLEIAKHFISHLKPTDIKEINTIIDEFERNMCNILNDILKDIKVEIKNKPIDFKVFQEELKKYSGGV